NRCRRMRRTEGIVFGLAALRKTGDSPRLAQTRHGITPAGEYFVWIGLMPDVPNQPIVGCIEDPMQGDGQLNRTKIGREVTTGARHRLQYELPQLMGDLFELATIQPTQIRRRMNIFEADVAH